MWKLRQFASWLAWFRQFANCLKTRQFADCLELFKIIHYRQDIDSVIDSMLQNHPAPTVHMWMIVWLVSSRTIILKSTHPWPSRSRDTDKVSIVLSIYVAASPTIHVGVIGWLVSSRTPILKSIDPAVPEISQAVTHPSTKRARCCLTLVQKVKCSSGGSNPADYTPPHPILHEFVQRYHI